MQTRNSADWLEVLEKNNVPCGPINNYEQVFQNEQVIHRKLKVDMQRADGARISAAASPLRLTSTPPTYDLPPPAVGQHTDEVLQQLLNIDESELTQLRKSCVI